MKSTHAYVAGPRSGTLSAILRHGLVTIAAFVVAGGVAGAVLTSLQAKKYTAKAAVLVTATGVESDATQANARTTGVINLDTEAQLVKSAAVADRAKRIDPSLRSMPDSRIIQHVRVTVPANTTVLKISYTAPTPARAQSGADAFARGYLADRQATAQALLTRLTSSAQSRVASLSAKLKALATEEASLPSNSDRRIYYSVQRTLYTGQISTLNQRLIGLSGTQITPGRVLTYANLPTSPSSPSQVLNIGSGVGVGLVIGVLVAWLRVTHRRTARRLDDLAHGTDLPALAVVRAGDANAGDGTATPDGEVYRRLAARILSTVERPAIVAISSVGTSRSDRAVTLQLAETLAGGGTAVGVLDIGEPRETSSAEHQFGFTSVPRVEQVQLRRGGASLSEAMASLRGDQEVLLVAVPCPTQTADAPLLVRAADAVLLVVDAGTRIHDVRASVAQFDSVSAPMLGVVLVTGPPRARAVKRSAARKASDAAAPRAASATTHNKGALSERGPSDRTEIAARNK